MARALRRADLAIDEDQTFACAIMRIVSAFS
jgi:hypothetical protein